MKILNKIIGAFLGLAMAIGTGFAVAAGSKEVTPVYAASPVTLTFTAACGGSGTDSDGNTWTITSDAAESNFDSNKGIHYGTNSATVEYIQLSTSGISGTVTTVVVNASGASKVTGNISVTVGGNSFAANQSFDSTAQDYTFTGSQLAGEIVVRVFKDVAAVKAIYCKSVSVTYSGDTPTPDPDPQPTDTCFVILPTDGTAIEASDYEINKLPINVTVTASTLTAEHIRVFKGKTITISGILIKKIEFTCTANDTAKYGPGCFAAQEGYTYSGKVGTWAGLSNSISFTAETNQVRITEIDIYIAAEGYATLFNSNDIIKCNSAGTTPPTYSEGYSWSVLENIYKTLDSAEKAKFTTPTSDTTNAVARYDYIVGKYGYEDFMHRNPAPIGNARALLTPIINTTTTYTTVIVIGLIAITAIGAYVFIRKKREN